MMELTSSDSMPLLQNFEDFEKECIRKVDDIEDMILNIDEEDRILRRTRNESDDILKMIDNINEIYISKSQKMQEKREEYMKLKEKNKEMERQIEEAENKYTTEVSTIQASVESGNEIGNQMILAVGEQIKKDDKILIQNCKEIEALEKKKNLLKSKLMLYVHLFSLRFNKNGVLHISTDHTLHYSNFYDADQIFRLQNKIWELPLWRD